MSCGFVMSSSSDSKLLSSRAPAQKHVHSMHHSPGVSLCMAEEVLRVLVLGALKHVLQERLLGR